MLWGVGMQAGGRVIFDHVHHGEQGMFFLGGAQGRGLLQAGHLEKADAVHVLRLLIEFPYAGLGLLWGL